MFTAQFPATENVSTVKLYESDANGTLHTYVLEMLDDGSYTSRDAVAGDNKFTCAFSKQFASTGEYWYAATVEPSSTTGTNPLSLRITVVPQPTTDQTAARLAEANTIQTHLDAALASAPSDPAAIAAALESSRTTLVATPGVVPSSVTTTGATVRWTTDEGLTYFAFAGLPGVKSSPAKDPALGAPSGIFVGGRVGGQGGVTAAAQTDSCNPKGRVLVLAPYFNFFTDGGDESNDIASSLRAAGYHVTHKCDDASVCPDGGVSVEDFKNMGAYDAVIVSSHGDAAEDGSAPILLTHQPYTSSYAADQVAGHITVGGGGMALTPAFFDAYTNQMRGSIVYFSACRSARGGGFARTFLDHGAASYIGYTDYVSTSFAVARGIAAFQHLISGGAVGDYGSATGGVDAGGARFRNFFSNAAAHLPVTCDMLNDTDINIQYTWPLTEEDLDTGTTFLNQHVGYACGGSNYMSFSGDDTSAGGQETIIVDVSAAQRDGAWQNTTQVLLRAHWYARNSPTTATVTVSLRDKATGALRGAQQKIFQPGTWTGDSCASDDVGVVSITASTASDNGTVSFDLTTNMGT